VLGGRTYMLPQRGTQGERKKTLPGGGEIRNQYGETGGDLGYGNHYRLPLRRWYIPGQCEKKNYDSKVSIKIRTK